MNLLSFTKLLIILIYLIISFCKILDLYFALELFTSPSFHPSVVFNLKRSGRSGSSSTHVSCFVKCQLLMCQEQNNTKEFKGFNSSAFLKHRKVTADIVTVILQHILVNITFIQRCDNVMFYLAYHLVDSRE